MPRDGSPARRRLMAAALELYAMQGYEATTTEQIADLAGVTRRTFFRHFPDKREVIFAQEAEMHEALANELNRVPAGTEPINVLAAAYRQLVPPLEADRDSAVSRQRIVHATPPLRERQLAKVAQLSALAADHLRARGESEITARVIAAAATAAADIAIQDWLSRTDVDLTESLDRAFLALQARPVGPDYRPSAQ